MRFNPREGQMKLISALLITLMAGVLPAHGGQVSSKYTKINLDKCKKLEVFEHNMGASFSCSGLPGLDVYVAEGDLRMFVAYGPGAKKQRAASQTFPNFNNIFKQGSNTSTLEWRVEKRRGKWQPFATILRYYIESDLKKGQYLVVSKVTKDEACHVGYINVRKYGRKANVKAREVADQYARGFDCKNDPVSYGE